MLNSQIKWDFSRKKVLNIFSENHLLIENLTFCHLLVHMCMGPNMSCLLDVKNLTFDQRGK